MLARDQGTVGFSSAAAAPAIVVGHCAGASVGTNFTARFRAEGKGREGASHTEREGGSGE